MTHLFAPLELRGVTLRNRVVMSPMCMYSAGEDGRATDWHLAHYLARAVGVWEDGQIAPLERIVRLCQEQGAAVGVQLAHAGRKAWSPRRGAGPATPVAPSAIPFDGEWVIPQALTGEELGEIVAAFVTAARRAEAARCDVIEIHAAHGYLLHEFLSPLSNQREDGYGGPLENRARLLLEVAEAARAVWPAQKPLLVRLSATDWVEGGLTVEDQVQVARWLSERGVEVVDCSSGGIAPLRLPRTGPGYQVPFAAQIRREAGVGTMAVGLITTPEQADGIVRQGQADLVALGRELLRHPYWPLDAAHALGQEIEWPRQYRQAKLA
jgi:2,4-dienoyl-CoA reductase-like NADH-dependent reductase (Old Yellow Enzyme family)